MIEIVSLKFYSFRLIVNTFFMLQEKIIKGFHNGPNGNLFEIYCFFFNSRVTILKGRFAKKYIVISKQFVQFYDFGKCIFSVFS